MPKEKNVQIPIRKILIQVMKKIIYSIIAIVISMGMANAQDLVTKKNGEDIKAKVIKKRFNDDDIEHLLNAKWWDWNDENIMRMLPMFYDDSMSVKDFLNKYK